MLRIQPFRIQNPRGHKSIVVDSNDACRDFYLTEAADNQSKLISLSYDILVDSEFAGFFCLSNCSLELNPEERMRKFLDKKQLSRIPPAALLGQIYICTAHRQKGYMSEALWHAIQICLASKTACRFLVLDVEKNKPELVQMYAKFGWISMRGMSRKMYLDLWKYKQFRKLLKQEIRRSLSPKEELRAFADAQQLELQQMTLI